MASRHWSTETYSVRERFGLGVILLATAYAAGLLVGCRLLRAPDLATVFLGGLLVWTAGLQLFARRLNAPRFVSLVGGAIYAVVWNAALTPYWATPLALLFVGLLGAFAGYAAGAIDASLFLVHDAIRDSLRAKRVEREALRAATGEKPRESPFDD